MGRPRGVFLAATAANKEGGRKAPFFICHLFAGLASVSFLLVRVRIFLLFLGFLCCLFLLAGNLWRIVPIPAFVVLWPLLRLHHVFSCVYIIILSLALLQLLFFVLLVMGRRSPPPRGGGRGEGVY